MKNNVVAGFRCSAKDFSFVALEGKRAAPKVLELLFKKYPTGFALPERLCWFHKEIRTLLQKHKPRYVVLKADESTTKSTSALERAYAEGVIFLAVGELIGKSACKSKRKVTLAKDLGLKGKAKYLSTLDTSPLDSFNDQDEKMQDAMLCAWSELT